MMRGTLTFLTLVSIPFLPWSFTATLAVVGAFVEPLVPLAAGIFADTLYYAPHTNALPLFTLYGTIVTLVAFTVRNRLRASIMR
jgi:hypothetical protein